MKHLMKTPEAQNLSLSHYVLLAYAGCDRWPPVYMRCACCSRLGDHAKAAELAESVITLADPVLRLVALALFHVHEKRNAVSPAELRHKKLTANWSAKSVFPYAVAADSRCPFPCSFGDV